MSNNQIKLKRNKMELTIEQKREICLFASDNPGSKQNSMCKYFSEKFKQNIPSTTMSDILKSLGSLGTKFVTKFLKKLVSF